MKPLQTAEIDRLAQAMLNQKPEHLADDLITMLFLNVLSKKGLKGLVWVADGSVGMVGFEGMTRRSVIENAMRSLEEQDVG